MKKIILPFIGLVCFTMISEAQSKYLSNIFTKADIRKNQDYLVVGINYWRYDTCLYSKQICKYNTSTGANIRTYFNKENIIYEVLRGNNSGFQSKNPYDTFKYVFVPQNLNTSTLVRKLLIKDKYIRIDTFKLSTIDTLLFDNYSLIKKVFGKREDQKSLKIYVMKSVDNVGSLMLHYWVERIGIIKLTDEKCWRYSFEMKDDRNKSIKRMFVEIIKILKMKYKDSNWLSIPCNFE